MIWWLIVLIVVVVGSFIAAFVLVMFALAGEIEERHHG